MSTETDTFRDPQEHTPLEDLYALATGCTLLAVGLVLMKQAGIVTAGVAGIALLVSYTVPLGVGLLFFLINIPFFLLAGRSIGREFLVKSVVACGLVFVLAALAQASMQIVNVHPAFAALAGGTCCGTGILALVRHNTGVGGVNILAVWLQNTRGWNLGRLHMVIDGLIILVATTRIPPEKLLWSVVSIVATNMILIAYHKPGRYLGH